MPRNNSRVRRDARKKSAKERMESRATRSNYDQVLLLSDRPGASQRELDRLIAGKRQKKGKKHA